MNENVLNDRKRREQAYREILGKKYEARRAGIDNADAVREAARFILQMRKHAKLTQAQLADRLGVSQARVSEMERGNSPEGVGYALLRRVAVACGFPNWPMAPVDSLAEKNAPEHYIMVKILSEEKGEQRGKVVFAGEKRAGGEYPFAAARALKKIKSARSGMEKIKVKAFDMPEGGEPSNEIRVIRRVFDESPLVKLVK